MVMAAKIAAYELTSVLGSGEFGGVFIGEHAVTKKKAAIKIFSKNEEWSAKIEICCYMRLKKTDCTPVLKLFGKCALGTYIVLDLFDASLESRLKSGYKYSLTDAINWGLDVLNALQIIHSKHIVHRDIKPANILIKNNRMYVCDFGLARIYEPTESLDDTHKAGNIGSTRYMSIHAHQGYKLYFGDDIESLGYIIWELLYNTLPWENQHNATVLQQKQTCVAPCIHLDLFLRCVKKKHILDNGDYILLASFIKRLKI